MLLALCITLCIARRRPQILARDEVGATEAADAGSACDAHEAGARSHAAAASARARVGAPRVLRASPESSRTAARSRVARAAP